MASSISRQVSRREKKQCPTLLRRQGVLLLVLIGAAACSVYRTAAEPGGTLDTASTGNLVKQATPVKYFRTSSTTGPIAESRRSTDTKPEAFTTSAYEANPRLSPLGGIGFAGDDDASVNYLLRSALSNSLLKYLSPIYWLRTLLGPEVDKYMWSRDGFCKVSRPLGEECRVLFDHIVIGCGAAGCPLARTLSEGGKKVLLIERGLERSFERTPNCMNIYGCGRVLIDESISQPIVTKQGIRTHAAYVMGGGTSLSKGIIIEEEPEYFEYLNKNFGYKWDIPRVYEAYQWASKRVYFPAPQDRPFAKAWRTSLLARGYKPLMPPGKRYTGGPLPNYYRFRLGYVWGGSLLFNSRERFFRYAADTLLGGEKGRRRNSNLTVLTNHAVQRILFDRISGQRPRAACILYRQTAYEDIQTLGAMHNATTEKLGRKAAYYFLVKNAKKGARFYTNHSKAATTRLMKACVHVEGEITVSAGAINTPLLLIRSGIGSKEQLEDIGVPPVKILPGVGKNLRDRLFIPLSFFSVIKKTDPVHYPARICEALGVAKLGPDCRNFKIGDRSLKCTLAGVEALYGGRMTEGVILGSRYIFPPAFRHHPLVDKAVEIMIYCARHRPLIQHLRDYLPACVTIEPLINCFRRGSAPFYFTAEPKTSGHVRIDRNGEVEVDFNYMKDEQDVFDAVRGMQNLLEAAKDKSWKGVLEPLSLKGCPVQILNGVLDLVATVIQKVYGDLLHGPALHAIRRNIGLLLPGNATVTIAQHEDTFRGGDALVTEETLPLYRKILEHLQKKQDRIESLLRATEDIPVPRRPYSRQQMLQTQRQQLYPASAPVQPKDQTNESSPESVEDSADDGSAPHFSEAESEAQPDSPGVQAALDVEQDDGDLFPLWTPSNSSTALPAQSTCRDYSFEHGFIRTCPAKDPFEQFYPIPPGEEDETEDPQTGRSTGKPPRDNEELRKLRASLDPEDLGRFWSNVLRPGTMSTQWLASYPPVLPRTDHPEEVARFVFSYMTSLWHLHGTSEMGKVIDADFNVIGVDNLSVVDASALTRITRMNPTATLIMMGRYVGLKKLDAWYIESVKPLAKKSPR